MTEVGPPDHRPWFDAAVLYGLAGVAVTQPLLDVLGGAPSLFIAAHYSRAQVVALAALVTVLPAGLAVVTVSLLRLVSTRVSNVAQRVFERLFIALFCFRLVRSVGIDSGLLFAAVAIAVILGLIELFDRADGLRRFAGYLGVIGLVLFPFSFIAFSRSASLLSAAPVTPTVEVPELDGPVVVVVFDELPVTSLMRGDGTINEDRFPAFAELARTSDWHRNASSPSSNTVKAVPALLTGQLPDEDVLATYRDQPHSLFTLLGGAVPVDRLEVVTDLCPPDVCDPPPSRPLDEVANDLAIVYGHRVLPKEARDRLPGVDSRWFSFGGETTYRDDGPRDDEWRPRGNTLAAGEERRLIDRARRIIDDPSLSVFHVITPHPDWTTTPWGDEQATKPLTLQELYQAHVMQVGAADRALGVVIDHLRSVGAWDDALVVVAADHGTSLTRPDVGKIAIAANRDEVLRMPMFIKAPHQTTGRVDDAPASTIDVLPSIIDLLGIDVDWELDGHSLYDGSEPHTENPLTDVHEAFAIARRHQSEFRDGTWRGLAATGEQRDLVGMAVDDLEVGAPSDLQWTVDERQMLADLPVDGVAVPHFLHGALRGSDGKPPALVLSVDGDIVGTTGTYVADGDGSWRWRGTVTDGFHEGANELRAYEVERTASGLVLHEVRSG